MAQSWPPVPVGVTCRLRDRTDCEQRTFPPLHQALQVEEDVHRSSFCAHRTDGRNRNARGK
jgi:hypothetical protein